MQTIQPSDTNLLSAAPYSSCMRDHELSSFPDPTMTDHDGQQVALPDGHDPG
jgi:hypothetical protein